MDNLSQALKGLDAATKQCIASGKSDGTKLVASLRSYLGVCGELAYTDPGTIVNAQQILSRAIMTHAYFNSSTYKGKIDPKSLHGESPLEIAGRFTVSKSDLLDKDSWYCPGFESFDNQTSGSTGARFAYRIWKYAYHSVERNRHYGMILKEFGIEDSNVLYVESGFPVNYSSEVRYGLAKIKVANKAAITNEFASLVCSHGNESGDYSQIAFGKEAYLHAHDYVRYVIDYIQKHNVNVLMASGGFFELLTSYLISEDTLGLPKLVDLLSNTGDRVNRETLEFLKETGIAKNWCDHMRCWDGGISFFTCSHGTYHIQDELAYVFNDGEGRLASIDFLSYPSPFINYLSGDYGHIVDGYEKCECGRWYRPFVFHNRRPMQYDNNAGGTFNTDEVINSILKKYPIGFMSVQDGNVSIEASDLTDEDKESIVLEMAKIYVMVNFFINPSLKKLSNTKVSMMAVCDGSPGHYPDNTCNNACGEFPCVFAKASGCYTCSA